MDLRDLSESDKYLMYGLLLKKKRSGAQERKVLAVVRSSLDLDSRIQALLRVMRAQLPEAAAGGADGRDGQERGAADGQGPGSAQGAGQGPDAAGARVAETSGARRRGKKRNALVVDARAEIAGLLKKCSLRRDLVFTRIAERYDAVHLIPGLRARLIVVNEVLESTGEYERYVDICRAIEPGVRVIFLGRPSYPVPAGPCFLKFARILAKPLNVEKLEESAKALLAVQPQA